MDNENSTPSRRHLARVAVATALLVVVAACSPSPGSRAGTGAAVASSPGRAAGSTGAISVAGNRLLRDGRPWVAHGLVAIAFVAAPKAATGVFKTAQDRFRPGDMTAMRAWGADSVRLQVSQPGLDPQNPLYDPGPAFLGRIVEAVRAARAAGLTPIVSVQDEEQSGEQQEPTDLPNDATRRVWGTLTTALGHDQGVVYEMLNEPRKPPSPEEWRRWHDAMSLTAATIRATGARNVLLADGLQFGERLAGAPDVDDPLHAVAYASHPYFHDADAQTPGSWDDKFGDVARTRPVVVTEWATNPTYYCDQDTARASTAFVDYLRARGIGLTAYAWDFDGDRFGSVAHGADHETSTFVGTRCGGPDYGVGQVVQNWYRGR